MQIATKAAVVLWLIVSSPAFAQAQSKQAQSQSPDASGQKDSASTAAESGKWIALFNGKNLDGWRPKVRYHPVGENYGNTFRVEDGLLKVRYDKDKYEQFGEKFGHLFTEQPYSHYRLRVEYRFVGEQCPGGPGWAIRNSGMMLHCENPDSMTLDQDFPASIEFQLLGGDGTHPRTTANLCTPGTNVVLNGKLFLPHCTNSSSKTYHGDQWVTCEVEVHGDGDIKHFVNGEQVLAYTQPQLDERDPHAKKLAEAQGGIMLKGGYIALQSESHPIDFRKVEIQILDSSR
ncbi:MAG: 3-keto-disaccharide hydrolase [Aureliella sp.]